MVLGRRHSRHAFPWHRHDALLLHLEDALGTGLPSAPLRETYQRAERPIVRVHDDPDVRCQHVLDGRGDESGARLELSLQYLDFIADRGHLCGARWTFFRDL